ncbi:MAG: hypothetical protein JXR70_17265 [Spirochaetales bacterium]|nr:hypothetical protein [Spirochaetales bacterium]
MSQFAVKYKIGTKADEIMVIEQKHSLKRSKTITALGIYYYQPEGFPLAAVKAEAKVDYVEEDRSIGIS